MKKFLCPIDQLDSYDNTINISATLAKEHDAELVLIHFRLTLNIPDIIESKSDELNFIRNNKTNAEYNDIVDQISREYGIKCTFKTKYYGLSISEAMQSELKSDSYDLVIMGTDGPSDVFQFYFGTTTFRTSQNITCPLLMFPKDYKYSNFHNVVYATDFKKSDIALIEKAVSFLKKDLIHITLLHITKEKKAVSQSKLSSFQEALEPTFERNELRYKVIEDADVPLALDEYYLENEKDLLILNTKNYNLLEKMLHESVTKKLSFIANYPVLIYTS